MIYKSIVLLLVISNIYGFNMECDIDDDCSPGLSCRMICKDTCKTKCINLNLLKDDVSKSSEEPFSFESNPFDKQIQRDNVTPLTISESELEEELKESFETTLPPNSELNTDPVPVEASSTLSSSGSELVPPEGNHEDKSSGSKKPAGQPPSAEPQPPGFTSFDDFKSGYEKQNKEKAVSTTTSSPSSGYDGDNVGIADSANSQNLQTTNTVITSTDTTESSTLSTFEPESTTEVTSELTTSIPENDTGTSLVPFDGGNNIGEAVPAEPLPDNGCPPPEVCEVNCGVFIDENGCQTCQCLWLAIPCETTDDCVEEGQFCDLGRCECMPGYLQDMRQSGICKRDESVPDSELQKIEAEVHHSEATTRVYPLKYRHKRSQTKEKPQHDRLEWPGPCSKDSQCPASLYCIQGDCWSLPEKLKEPLLQHSSDDEVDDVVNEERRSFKINHDESEKNEFIEASTTTPLPSDDITFDFDAFPKPPSISSTTMRTVKIHQDFNEPQPPSLRPLDDDEASFLGDFGNALSVVSSTTITTLVPVTRSTEPIPTRKFRTDVDFNKEKLNIPPKVKHEGRSERQKHPKNLSELLAGHHFDSTNFEDKHPNIDKNLEANPIDNETSDDDSTLPRPKNRNPQVDSAGWKPMSPIHVNSPEVVRQSSKENHDQRHPSNGMMTKVILNYSNRMGRPVRVEMYGAKHVIRDECSKNRHCGEHYVCCEKKYCDLTMDCGFAKFCLPDCDTTKMTYLSSSGIDGMPLIDLVYD